ncbi:tripartite tricarboxylate transporter substrate binding protein [Sporosarcina sp. PTS2304]|uniref:Bug family tripartite tricarboxylate transporter substrate binding protein n=1 Tax=Sporosarcina sp. PTS2304 TaxID=2283194 RepID=UPI000E0DB93C|nr:tripartite tricarboxylate transporter substrate binding protein [Sporosarcina sp. PTS2304]AXH99548.1 tripartite tricarboxylate transporter substrate binding protein [Sporosarcina sp. PTS2304]
MKKLFILMLTALMVLLAACGTNKENAGDDGKTPSDGKSTYPEKDIEIVVPFPPGGTTDTSMRIIASVLPKYLPNKVNVVVVNKPGGTGVVGSTTVSNAKPDGYQILYSTVPTIAYQNLFGTASYTHEDFTPIVNVQASQSMLMVSEDAEWDTFEQWLEYVQKNPGKFTYGTPGNGSSQHLTMEALNINANIDTKMVPFDGTSSALTSLLGGHIDGIVIQAHEVQEYVENGDLKPIVFLGDTRYSAFPDVPLLTDFGYDEVFSDPSSGVFGPKGMDEDVAKILYEAFTEAFKDPKVVEFYEGLKLEPEGTGLKDFESLIQNNYEIAKKVIETNNLGAK